MIAVRPVSDLQNGFDEIEKMVDSGETIFLTDENHKPVVLMSMDSYSKLGSSSEKALDEADDYAENSNERMSHEEVFEKIRNWYLF